MTAFVIGRAILFGIYAAVIQHFPKIDMKSEVSWKVYLYTQRRFSESIFLLCGFFLCLYVFLYNIGAMILRKKEACKKYIYEDRSSEKAADGANP